jgi:vancomycin resistance protein YoaR
MARHREITSGWLWVLPSLVIPLIIAAIAWTTHVAGEGQLIAPNVSFAGLDVSGLSVEAAAEEIGERESRFLDTPVTVDLGERSVVLSAGEIGYDYLFADTLAAVSRARHGDGPWGEFLSWATAPFQEVTVADRFTLDESVARERLSADDFVLEFPVEPELAHAAQAGIQLVPGIDGLGIDIDHLVTELSSAEIATGTVEVDAVARPLEPSVSDEAAAELAVEANAMTKEGLRALVGPRTARLTPSQIRAHVRSAVAGGEIRIAIDLDGLQRQLESAFPGPVGEFVPPRLEVVDGNVTVLDEGLPAPVCCSTESVQSVIETLLDGGTSVYRLETRPDTDERVLAWADGSQVKDMVASFTTNHACCENRVTNIQTIADELTGVYLVPGQTLSLNELVGPRTRENGYLPAGAIRGGYMTDEVGGGVSQFVTTMFNAAFFGGLDLDEYQSHTVYFSRYPYGREATLSIPGPDLVITNTTDYPVLIWPTYDANSITVSLYSTEHIEVEELDQRISRRRQCTHSEIDRQRTYPDGRVLIDTIVANYRPAEGVDCNGNVIPRP